MIADVGLEMLLVAEIDQRIEIGDAFDDHVAALAATAAIGAAEFDELLTAETLRARAAVTAFQEDLSLVEKFHRVSPMKKGNGKPIPLLNLEIGEWGLQATGFPAMKVRCPDLCWNSRGPSSTAKSL